MPSHEIITPMPGLPVFFLTYQSYDQLIPSHWHNHLEVIYLHQGTMYVKCADESFTLHQGDMFIVNSGEIHMTQGLGHVEVLLLQIPYDLFSDAFPTSTTFRFQEFYPQTELRQNIVYRDLIQHLLSLQTLYEEVSKDNQLLFISRLYLFLHTLYKEFLLYSNDEEQNKATKQLSRLKIVFDYVEQNYAEPISLTETASLVALNPEYFCRTFKQHTGFTFLTYVNLVRLSHIHNDLLETDDSVTTIQQRHGFTNYKLFNRMFKQVYGCVPSRLKATRSAKGTVNNFTY